MDSIVNSAPGRDIDTMTTLEQIGSLALMRVGFVPSSVLYSRDYIKFQVSCDGRRKVWVIIKLDANDTYSVEFGKIVRKFEWKVLDQISGVYCDMLAEVIDRGWQKVYA